jgi:uncharacterized protein VirK/YbjX
MNQSHQHLSHAPSQKPLLRQERQLSNPAYAKYLYEKYKIRFSANELQYTFNGQKFSRAAPLIQLLHRYERTEANLNTYVLALFLVLLCAAMGTVLAIDLYLQSFH